MRLKSRIYANAGRAHPGSLALLASSVKDRLEFLMTSSALLLVAVLTLVTTLNREQLQERETEMVNHPGTYHRR